MCFSLESFFSCLVKVWSRRIAGFNQFIDFPGDEEGSNGASKGEITIIDLYV
jgi:hypothetical protein